MPSKPLLSICIPTYNRAELLRSALYSIVRQTAQFGQLVELVVSDNASSDHTSEVVTWSQQFGSVRYYRNNENIGAGRNFLHLTQKLAKGEYCWLLGDDDLLHEDAVKEVLEEISSHSEIDYFFVNNSYESSLMRGSGLIESTRKFASSRCSCTNQGRKTLERWEHIIQYAYDGTLFTFIGNHILRTSIWQREVFDFQTDAGFPSLQATFPHACTVSRHMIGKPAFYLGNPLVIAFLGDQDWHSSWPMLQLVRVLEFAEFMAGLGAESAMVNRYRSMALSNSSTYFWRFLTDANMPGRQHFRVGHLFKTYWKHKGFCTMLFRFPTEKYITLPFQRLLRVLNRLFHGQPLRPATSLSLPKPSEKVSE